MELGNEAPRIVARAKLARALSRASCTARDSPDLNVIKNHTHPAAVGIQIRKLASFVLDPRLF